MPIMTSVKIYKGAVCAAVVIAAAALSAFRAPDGGGDKIRLRGITTPADKTVITYNSDKSIAKLVTTHGNDADKYTTVRIPVYNNGRLIQTLFSDEEAGTPMLFSSLEYDGNGRVVKIKYYSEDQVSSYDSLAYNAAGNIDARYFFNKENAGFQNHNCQLYTWDNKGNVIQVTSMGRSDNQLPFTQGSVASYRYDEKQNANKNTPELLYITDITAANLSASNVVAEEITGAGSVVTNRFEYAYNAQQYPVHVTAKYAATQETVSTELEWE